MRDGWNVESDRRGTRKVTGAAGAVRYTKKFETNDFARQ
jgi:hypothetical protein